MNLFRTTVAMAALMAALMSADAAWAARAYIGTYTKDPAAARGAGGGGNGEGIYMVDIDEATGAPSHLRLMAKDLSPSWITLVGGPQVSLCGERDRDLWPQQERFGHRLCGGFNERRPQEAQCGGFRRLHSLLHRSRSDRKIPAGGQLHRRQLCGDPRQARWQPGRDHRCGETLRSDVGLSTPRTSRRACSAAWSRMAAAVT